MRSFCNERKVDAIFLKNIEESEIRSEGISRLCSDSEALNTKSIHNKAKDYR
jgi:hypothetical protein